MSVPSEARGDTPEARSARNSEARDARKAIEPTPLTRPQHLRPAAPSWLTWIIQRLAGAIAAVLGLALFVVVAVTQPVLWATPDWRLSVPGVVATAIASVISIARQEPGAYPLWLIGLGLACAALVLGWFLVLAIVIAATMALILVLHALM